MAELASGNPSAWWGLPFAGMLLSMALWPMLAPAFWHRHFGKVALGWSLALLLPLAVQHGWGHAFQVLAHALAGEYLPFIVLLTALYVVAGGVWLHTDAGASPRLNTGLLAAGGLLANLMGTTGAAMLLVRPLLRANARRQRKTHVLVFFIIIVCNTGGVLTPLGDPPLFLGFLRGVDFFWPARQLWPQALFVNGCLLAGFWALDAWCFRRDGTAKAAAGPAGRRVLIEGWHNLALLAAMVALVLVSGLWRSGTAVQLPGGVAMPLPALVRDAGLLLLAGLSWMLTPPRLHAANQFAWGPMLEVAKLFAGIFVTMAPVVALLQLGSSGPFGPVLAAVARPDGKPDLAMYFWISGALSAFLDSAPAYLVFFNAAGGDARQLMGEGAAVLAAISAGTVFMGANSYIGNAPNMMVRAVAQHEGVAMPGFFGYVAWAGVVLLPLYMAMTWIWLL
jgi:Na+/H+ antiporter NhaD/arsenite permease-like protein